MDWKSVELRKKLQWIKRLLLGNVAAKPVVKVIFLNNEGCWWAYKRLRNRPTLLIFKLRLVPACEHTHESPHAALWNKASSWLLRPLLIFMFTDTNSTHVFPSDDSLEWKHSSSVCALRNSYILFHKFLWKQRLFLLCLEEAWGGDNGLTSEMSWTWFYVISSDLFFFYHAASHRFRSFSSKPQILCH